MGFIRGYRPLTKDEVDRYLNEWKMENEDELAKLSADDRFDAIEEKRMEIEDEMMDTDTRSHTYVDPMRYAGHRLSDFA